MIPEAFLFSDTLSGSVQLSAFCSVPAPLSGALSSCGKSGVSHPSGSVPSFCCSIFTRVSPVCSSAFTWIFPELEEAGGVPEESGRGFVRNGAWPAGLR